MEKQEMEMEIETGNWKRNQNLAAVSKISMIKHTPMAAKWAKHATIQTSELIERAWASRYLLIY